MEEGKVNNPQTSHNNQVSDDTHVKETSKFIQETSLDKMHEIAEAARMKKMMEPPKWVFPDEP